MVRIIGNFRIGNNLGTSYGSWAKSSKNASSSAWNATPLRSDGKGCVPVIIEKPEDCLLAGHPVLGKRIAFATVQALKTLSLKANAPLREDMATAIETARARTLIKMGGFFLERWTFLELLAEKHPDLNPKPVWGLRMKGFNEKSVLGFTGQQLKRGHEEAHIRTLLACLEMPFEGHEFLDQNGWTRFTFYFWTPMHSSRPSMFEEAKAVRVLNENEESFRITDDGELVVHALKINADKSPFPSRLRF